jgi:hypothetical protein
MNRRSTLTIVLSLFLFVSIGFAQKSERPFRQGIWIAQGSVGFISGGLYGDVKVPPMNFVLEYAANNEYAYGFFGGYASSRVVVYRVFGEDWGFDYNYLILAGSASYHFEVDMKNVDGYGRVFLGYAILSASTFGPPGNYGSANASFAVYGAYVGATYYLTPQFGVQGEVGYGNIAVLRFGITLKFQ